MRKVFYPVARKSEIRPGTGRVVRPGTHSECVVFVTDDGRCFACNPLCPHMNEPLDRGRLEGCEVICRRHHLRFDLSTGNCTNAGGYWLQTLEVRLDGDVILVGIWED
ncbi:MAG: Rieske (2Fe-2S) protein [Chthonomonadales bacterium]